MDQAAHCVALLGKEEYYSFIVNQINTAKSGYLTNDFLKGCEERLSGLLKILVKTNV